MALLPRLWLRQLFKLVVSIFILSFFVLFTDFYFNFLPTSIQTKLPGNHPSSVIIDFEVKSCLTVSGCAEPNGWYKIPKNLYLNSKWVKKGFVFVKKLNEEDLEDDQKVILDIALSKGNEVNKHGIPVYIVKDVVGEEGEGGEMGGEEGGVKEVGEKGDVKEEKVAREEKIKNIDKRSESNPRGKAEFNNDVLKKSGWVLKDKSNGIWVKYGKYHRSHSISDINVLFGKDSVDPRPGWVLRKGWIMDEESFPRLSIQKGVAQVAGTKPVLRVNSDGKFKILQVADLHFSTGEGVCRDQFPHNDKNCKADPKTIDFINEILVQEKPDLVVLTGDQVFGDTSPDSETAILKAASPFINYKVPYAMVFGNHDDQGSLNKEQLMAIISSLPYSLSEFGPNDIDGVGNYVLQALSPKNNHPALSFYFLDSHNKVQIGKEGSTYDYIKLNQLGFVKNESARLKDLQKDYTHIPLSMSFFHIPLPEYRKTDVNPTVGSFREAVIGPKSDEGTRDVLGEIGVSVVSVGHDHVNDYCIFDSKKDGEKEISKMWLCYGGAVGEGGYGGYGGYIRRLRLFELDTQSGSIKTWKVTHEERDKKIDEQTLVVSGKAVNE